MGNSMPDQHNMIWYVKLLTDYPERGSLGLVVHFWKPSVIFCKKTLGLPHSAKWWLPLRKANKLTFHPQCPLWLVKQQGDLLNSSAKSLIAAPPAMTLTWTLSHVACSLLKAATLQLFICKSDGTQLLRLLHFIFFFGILYDQNEGLKETDGECKR